MDGTAAVGTGTTYARADHVHPTDTSRANANAIESATISSSAVSMWALGGKNLLTAIEGAYSLANGKQSALVSGTNIKTVNGESLLGSGNITAGVSMATATATLPTSGWSSDSITVNVTGVTASNNVIVAPAPASVSAYAAAGIVCTAQGSGTLTFTRTSANTSSITVNVLILG